jgi:hypothetical protein
VEQEQEHRLGAEDWIRDWERDFGEVPPPPPRGAGPDLAPLFAIAEALRRGVPRELQDQFNSLLREVLLTLRALIDWYLERLERGERRPEVEDIPIE